VDEHASPTAQSKALDAFVASLVMRFDIDALDAPERELLKKLKRLGTDIKLDVRDYNAADSQAEQQRLEHEARARLAELEQAIAKAGELNLFSAVEVAHLSANAQQLTASL
jgi:hypothetical protein